MDREVERLLNQCAQLTADPEIASEDAEKPLLEAVELLKLTESVAGFPEALAPENWLLCAEAALGVGNVKLAHSSLESFMIVQPCRDQFLARAYFAMGRVQSAYCAGLKAQELLDYTMILFIFLDEINAYSFPPGKRCRSNVSVLLSKRWAGVWRCCGGSHRPITSHE